MIAIFLHLLLFPTALSAREVVVVVANGLDIDLTQAKADLKAAGHEVPSITCTKTLCKLPLADSDTATSDELATLLSLVRTSSQKKADEAAALALQDTARQALVEKICASCSQSEKEDLVKLLNTRAK